MINGFVKGQSLKLSQPEIVANSNDYLEMRFIFQTADWGGLSVWAHFTQDEKTVFDINLKNCMITREDHLNLSEGKWKVYLHGNDLDGTMRITTDVQELTVKPAGFICAPLPEIPLSAAEQIDQKAQRAEDKANEALEEVKKVAPLTEEAKQAAQEAKKSAESAKQSETSAKKSESSAKESSETAVTSAGQAVTAAEQAKKNAEQTGSDRQAIETFVQQAGDIAGDIHADVVINESLCKQVETDAKQVSADKTAVLNAKTAAESASKAAETFKNAAETASGNASNAAMVASDAASSASDSALSAENAQKVATEKATSAETSATSAKADADRAKEEVSKVSGALDTINKSIQDLENDKADRISLIIADDKITQDDARGILGNAGQYEGKLIEFLTNNEMPNKAVAWGYLMTDKSNNTYLVTWNRDATMTQWNKDSYEKHMVESRNLSSTVSAIDELTIDSAGDPPFYATVSNAYNKPPKSGEFGIVFVIAYSSDKQIQIYQDAETGNKWQRTITGQADRHSFGTWEQKNGAPIDDEKASKKTLFSSAHSNQIYANAFKNQVSGEVIAVDDVSPVEHEIKCTVSGVPDLSAVTVSKHSGAIDFRKAYAGNSLFTDLTVSGYTTTSNNISHGSLQGASNLVDLASAETTAEFDVKLVNTNTSVNAKRLFFAIYDDSRKELYSRKDLYIDQFDAFKHFKIDIPKLPTQKVRVRLTAWEKGKLPNQYTVVDRAVFYPTSEKNNFLTPLPSGEVHVTSSSPSMTILSDTPGVIITAEYNQDGNAVIKKLSDRIAELESKATNI